MRANLFRQAWLFGLATGVLVCSAAQRILWAALALCVVLVPIEGRAALIFSDVELTAFTEVTTQLLPRTTDFDSTTASPGFGAVRALSVARAGVPFPNLPNSVGSAFASAAQFGDLFGVGVNGFFRQNSLPP